MKLSYVLLTICAFEMVFWMQVSTAESTELASQLMDRLGNTKSILLSSSSADAQLDILDQQDESVHLDSTISSPTPKVPHVSAASVLRPPHTRHQPGEQRSQHTVPSDEQRPQTPKTGKPPTEQQENSLPALGSAWGIAAVLLMALGWGSRSVSRDALKQLISCLVWVGILALPLSLGLGLWKQVFHLEWCRAPVSPEQWPSPLGLLLGLLGVAIGQVAVITYHFLRCRLCLLGPAPLVQTKPQARYDFSEGIVTHLAQPEGFVLLGSYLSITWMLRVMPDSYYQFEGGIQWHYVGLQLLLTDATQFAMHCIEHQFASFYKKSHKPHHRFINPRLFDAFNGSPEDTCFMILLPLAFTAQMVHCNLWSYIAFGSLYANWLTLIHSEVQHPWDRLFQWLGFGTPGDHHVHHKYFVKNFGHLFLYWDRLFGTYQAPKPADGFEP